MQSKHALVNHYKSLSLMQGDDLNKLIHGSTAALVQVEQVKDDFDDISSIYTAHANNKATLENTLKRRVKDRQLRLSMMHDGEAEDILNINKQIDALQNIEANGYQPPISYAEPPVNPSEV